MNKVIMYIFLLFPYCILSSSVENELLPYRDYLEAGTFEGWPEKCPKPKSRYYTFKEAFEHLLNNNKKVVVELGTSRSFTHGGLPGCNSDDPTYWEPDQPQNWDWGAGFFTRMASICLKNAKIHTVDISASHIRRCQIINSDCSNIFYYVSDSREFLEKTNFSEGIDLIYLDTGDMTPLEESALLQLSEAQIIVQKDLLNSDGLILIDDVRNQTPKKFGEESNLGKAKYSLPYLLQNGFKIVLDEYQVLLKK